MKADVKAQWVKDLRSGEFVQGHNVLDRIVDGQREFCCLGVLCQQAVKAGVIPTPELRGGKQTYSYLDDRLEEGKVTGEEFNQECSLPRKVAEWAGVSPETAGLGSDVIILPESDEDGKVTAIGANDGMGMSFAQIADLIEQNVPAE